MYWRLRRRLLEAQVRKRMEDGGHKLETRAHLDSILSRWFTEDQGPVNVSILLISTALIFTEYSVVDFIGLVYI
jgi:hypothetical protein